MIESKRIIELKLLRLSSYLQEVNLENTLEDQDIAEEFERALNAFLVLNRKAMTSRYLNLLVKIADFFDNWPLRAEVSVMALASIDFHKNTEIISLSINRLGQAVLRLAMSGVLENLVAQYIRRLARLKKLNSYCKDQSIESYTVLERNIEKSLSRLSILQILLSTEAERQFPSNENSECPRLEIPQVLTYDDTFYYNAVNSISWKVTSPLRAIASMFMSIRLGKPTELPQSTDPYESILNSASWKITAPLRLLRRFHRYVVKHK